MKYYNNKISEVYKELKTDKEGLTEAEVNKRLSIYGENELIEAEGKSKLKILLSQFNDMMIIILIIVAIIMAIYGYFYSNDYTDSIVIGVVVLINAVMGFIQEAKAEVTLDGLKKYAVSSCKVRRNGVTRVVDSKYIVPGDVIILEAGDKVPADARIIETVNVQVDESPLTGESVPVKKISEKIKGNTLQIQDQKNMLFSGSNITNGRVEAVVVKTGMITELGLIAVSLNTPYEVETPLQIKIKEISKKLTILIFIILLFIFGYGIYSGYKIVEIIMLCVTLAVAAIPEGLPAVITITLSTGAGMLAKKKTVVRQMSAVETLGSADVICSDKTGTITQNKMKVKKTIIYNEEMFKYISILANDAIIDGKKYVGDPTETCLYDHAKNKGNNPEEIKESCERLMSAPFDSERKMMSSINVINGKKYILVKGSLENLLDRCTYIYNEGKKLKISKSLYEIIRADEKEMAESALRVIGFAYKEIKELPKNDKKMLEAEDGLIYAGMCGMIDPPRPSVTAAVKKCKKAGIRPIMITGDSLITACAIAKEVGIIDDASEGILGKALDDYTDEELLEVVQKYKVYARVSPDHKTRIVKAWQSLGKVVAMTGDGVNDAPAIKDAHVGVGMGITGTEVTKSVADVVILDDSFSTIVTAVEEGRRIFTNIRNNVVYSLSSNFAEIITVLVGMFTGTTILIPIHILFIDLVTDSIPSICLSYEKAERDVMERNPRGIDKPIFTPFVYANIAFSSIVEAAFVLITFFIISKGYNTEVACTLALLSMVIQEIVYSISCRNLKHGILRHGLFSNKQFNIGLIILIIIESIVFFTPIGAIINVASVDTMLLLKVIGLNIMSFVLYEIVKPLFRLVFKD